MTDMDGFVQSFFLNMIKIVFSKKNHTQLQHILMPCKVMIIYVKQMYSSVCANQSFINKLVKRLKVIIHLKKHFTVVDQFNHT